MIIDNMAIVNLCTSFEGVLHLEYSESTKTEECLNAAIKALENDYNITIDKDIYTLQAENSLVSKQIDMLLQSITECMKSTALFILLGTFHHSVSLSLSSANYLGLSRDRLLTALKYLQDKDTYTKRSQSIGMISDALNTVPVCHTKRFFMILLMLEKLGISEGVSIIAQLLYLGGIV